MTFSNKGMRSLKQGGIGVDDMVGSSRNSSLAFFLYCQHVIRTYILIQSTVGVLKTIAVEILTTYMHFADGVTILFSFSIYQYFHNNKFNNE